MIVLDADNTVLEISFSIVDDSIFELIETLSASLSFSSSSVTGVTLDPTSAEIIILDNDGKSIMTFREVMDSQIIVLTTHPKIQIRLLRAKSN